MENVGGIQYVVEANTAQLLKAEQDTQRSITSMERNLGKLGTSSKQVDKVTEAVKDMGKEVKKSDNALSTMQKTLLGMATIGTATTVAAMADNYRTLMERVNFATQSEEEFLIVQERIISTANEAYRSMSEVSEVFIGTSDNLRGLGYSLNEALDITDSLTFAFVKNATTTEQARNALRQYDIALNKGKVDMMGWQVINNAVPTLAKDIADSLGVTTQEVLNMGIASEITAKQLNDALLNSFESNKEAATGMATSVADAFVKLNNNFTRFIGEANKTTGATSLVASGIDVISDNLEELSNALILAGAYMAGKYVAGLAASTAAQLKNLATTRLTIIEELRLAQINVASAQAEVARTARIAAMTGVRSKHVAAIQAEAIATANLQRAQQASISVGRSFLSLLGGAGGIIGLLTVGATAFMMFKDGAEETKVELNELKQSLPELISQFKELNEIQRSSKMVQYGKEVEDANKKVSASYEELTNSILNYKKSGELFGSLRRTSAEEYDMIRSLKREIDETIKSGGDLNAVINRLADDMGVDQGTRDAWIQYAGSIDQASSDARKASESLNELKNINNELASATDKATLALDRQNQAMKEAGAKTLDGLIDGLQKQKNIIDDNGSALKRFNRELKEAQDAGQIFDDDKITKGRELAKVIDDNAKNSKSASKSYKEASDTLSELRNELYLASLSGKELAIARAEQRLGDFASAQEVQQVRELAAAIYDLNEIKKFGDTAKEQDAFFTQGDPLSGGAFDDQVARYEQELILEEERYAKLLEQFQLFREAKLRTEEEYNAIEDAMTQKHADRIQQIQRAQMSVTLSSYSDAFGGIADILKNAQGEQSGAYKAMFAVSKAFSLANATLKLSEAIVQAMADPSALTLQQKLANYAAVASAGTAVIASISGASFGGGRQYGGSVNPESFYRINETGQPEIFDAGGGKQYFLPNSRGEVIPTDKAFGKSQGANVTVNLIENKSRGGEVDQQSTDEETVINIFVANIAQGGDAAKSIEQTYGVSRVGR